MRLATFRMPAAILRASTDDPKWQSQNSVWTSLLDRSKNSMAFPNRVAHKSGPAKVRIGVGDSQRRQITPQCVTLSRRKVFYPREQPDRSGVNGVDPPIDAAAGDGAPSG